MIYQIYQYHSVCRYGKAFGTGVHSINIIIGQAGVKIVFTSRVCDSHEHQVPLRNVHPVCHCLQQLLGYHPSMCPHAQVRVHGNIHVTQHCNGDNIVSVRALSRLYMIALLYNQRQTRRQVLEGNWMESSFLNDKAFQKTSRPHNNARMALSDHLHLAIFNNQIAKISLELVGLLGVFGSCSLGCESWFKLFWACSRGAIINHCVHWRAEIKQVLFSWRRLWQVNYLSYKHSTRKKPIN